MTWMGDKPYREARTKGLAHGVEVSYELIKILPHARC